MAYVQQEYARTVDVLPSDKIKNKTVIKMTPMSRVLQLSRDVISVLATL